ncbi:MAG: DUF3300 domain-containing protein, partial [Polymorphobacter sp.]
MRNLQVAAGAVPAVLMLALLFAASSGIAATTPPPASAAASSMPVAAPTANETLIARVALYPDDLIAIILPASTYPLQVVEAARYLDSRAKDPKLPIKESWDASVKSLVNYPTVIKAMNTDLDWMQALGDAVVADQNAVLAAVQSYRRKVYAAGNLKTDDKQVVAMDADVITIAPANPQVIYVPEYNPATIMVYGGYSSWGYYGYGYPSYYYPYAPGAALAAGLIWGAAIGAAWNGGHYVAHYGGYGGYGGGGIRINNGDINVGSGNRPATGAGNRPGGGNSGTAWKPSAQPRTSTGRVGDAGGGMGPSASTGAIGVSAGNRGGGASAGQYGPSASGASNRVGTSAGQYGPPSTGASDRSGYGGNRSAGASAGQYGGNRGSTGASSFGGYGSGHSTSMASSRGSMSRSYSGGGRRR